MNKNPIIQNDILQYKKNKFASGFALLGVALDALYLMLFYSINASKLYQIVLGLSVIVNLVVLLFGFYASEGIKNYDKKFCIFLIALAVVQVVRIFILPLQGLTGSYLTGHYFGAELNSVGMFVILLIYLLGSAACFVIAAVQGYFATIKHDRHAKEVEEGKIDMDSVLAEEEKAELAAAAEVDNGEVQNG